MIGITKRRYVRKSKEEEKPFRFDALTEAEKELYNKIYDEFNNTPILILREKARTMGIKSATTMTKADLVEKMTIVRFSRTVYTGGHSDLSLGVVTYGEISDLTDDFWQRTYIARPAVVKGILKIERDGGWLCKDFIRDHKTDAFIPIVIIEQYKLQDGDEITAHSRMLLRAARLGVFKILAIGGKSVASFKRKPLKDLKTCDKRLELTDGNHPFLKAMSKITPFFMGERKLVIGLNALKTGELALEISQKLSEAGLETVNLFLNHPPEAIESVKALNGITLAPECNSSVDYDESVMLAVEYSLSLAAAGRNAALILNNADLLTEKTLRAVLGAGRFSDKGSLTSVVFSSCLELEPAINKLSQNASSVTVFKREAVPVIDVIKSFTEFERLLPEPVQETLLKIRKNTVSMPVDEFNSTCDLIK